MSANEKVAALASEWAGRTVTRVDATGSDWSGDTESGFFSTFEVVLSGPDGYYNKVEGEEMASLWKFVMEKAVGA